MVDSTRAYRVGHRVEDHCWPCKSQRAHTIAVVGPGGEPERVVCDTCGSQHNYRGGALEAAQSPASAATRREDSGRARVSEGNDPRAGDESELESVLRRVLREEAGIPPTAPAEKWRGGELLLRPGKPGLQEKTMSIDALFHKIVMVRNKLRVLEQQINGADIPDDLKIKLQGYVTGCYGSLTSFNVLFSEDADRFRGSGKR